MWYRNNYIITIVIIVALLAAVTMPMGIVYD